jgi:hypothetical protein
MQDVLSHSPSIVVDDKLKGLVPFLSLSGEGQSSTASPAALSGPSGGPSSAGSTATSGNAP